MHVVLISLLRLGQIINIIHNLSANVLMLQKKKELHRVVRDEIGRMGTDKRRSNGICDGVTAPTFDCK